MKQLYMYALVQSLYDESKDYLECFLPFIATELDLQPSKIIDVQQSVNDAYSIIIPQHTLATLIKRGIKKGYFEGNKDSVVLSKQGQEWVRNLQDQRGTERETNELISALHNYFTKHTNQKLTLAEAEQCLYQYIDSNLESLRYFFNQGALTTR